MLIEADASGEQKIRTNAMPVGGLIVADRNHDAGRFPRLEDHHDFVGLCPVEVGIDEASGEGIATLLKIDVLLAVSASGSLRTRSNPLARLTPFFTGRERDRRNLALRRRCSTVDGLKMLDPRGRLEKRTSEVLPLVTG